MVHADLLLDAQHFKRLAHGKKKCWEGNGKPPSITLAKKMLQQHQHYVKSQEINSNVFVGTVNTEIILKISYTGVFKYERK